VHVLLEVAFTCYLCTSCLSSKKKGGEKAEKKDGKKAEKEADIKEMSVTNSNLWQARLEVIEQSRIEHRSCDCFGISISLFQDLLVFYTFTMFPMFLDLSLLLWSLSGFYDFQVMFHTSIRDIQYIKLS